MSSENNFFKDLGEQWQAELDQPEFTVEKALKVQRTQKIKNIGHIALSIASLFIAIFFLMLPISVVTVVASIVLICGVAVDWYYSLRFRRPISRWENWSSEGLVIYHQSLLRAEVRNAKYMIFSSVGLLVFVVFLWGLSVFDQSFSEAQFHQIFSAISVPISLIFIFYHGRSLKKNRRRLASINGLRKVFSERFTSDL